MLGNNFCKNIVTQIAAALIYLNLVHGEKLMLFDFTTMSSVDNWEEMSDTVRSVGKSKATLSLVKDDNVQKGVLYTNLVPQPNGACFAGVRTPVNFNLSDYSNIELAYKSLGKNDHYKVVLRHEGLHSNEDIAYEQIFTAPVSKSMEHVKLPLSEFKPYYRGREVKDAKPLNTSDITMLGLQMFGGVYLPYKQSGESTFEIYMIYATK